MSRFSLSSSLVASFYSPDLYRDVVFRWKGIGVLYLLVLLVIAWIPSPARWHFALRSFAAADSRPLISAGQALQAQSDDAQVLSAAIAHYSATRRNGSQLPLLVIAAETIESDRILLGRFDRAEAPEIPASTIQALRQRNAKAQPIGDIRLPASALLVRDAIGMTRHVTPAGAEVADWSPFTHAYPGSQLVQLAAPAYFTPGQKALVYFWAGIGPEGIQGWLYILEKRGSEWHVTWSESPWIA